MTGKGPLVLFCLSISFFISERTIAQSINQDIKAKIGIEYGLGIYDSFYASQEEGFVIGNFNKANIIYFFKSKDIFTPYLGLGITSQDYNFSYSGSISSWEFNFYRLGIKNRAIGPLAGIQFSSSQKAFRFFGNLNFELKFNNFFYIRDQSDLVGPNLANEQNPITPNLVNLYYNMQIGIEYVWNSMFSIYLQVTGGRPINSIQINGTLQSQSLPEIDSFPWEIGPMIGIRIPV